MFLITLISKWFTTLLCLIEVGLLYLWPLRMRLRMTLTIIILCLIGADLVMLLCLEVGLFEFDLAARCGGGSGTTKVWVHVRYAGRGSYYVTPGNVFSVTS